MLKPNPDSPKEGGSRLRGRLRQSEQDKPLITVVTATYNAAEHLTATIKSIRAQAHPGVEWIVIDGGSTDGTIDLLRQNDDLIDYWVSESDSGIYSAWNKGVLLASSDWIAFLGAGDSYLEGAIQAYEASIHSSLKKLPQYISSQVNLTSGSRVLRTIGQQWNWKTFRKYMNVAHVGSLHHRLLFEKYGLFDESYKISGDYEFLLRAGSNLRAAYLNAITVNMSVGGISGSNSGVFSEAARAKITTARRSPLMTRIETYVAVCKWKLRNWLWR